jgi:hypothetical protein
MKSSQNQAPQPAQNRPGTALVRVDEIRNAAQLPAERWSDERINAVLSMLAPEARTVAQAALFLATCDRYQLDPTVGEAWLGQIKGKPTVLTGRDSYIKIAQRDPGYAGYDADVVREKDEFSVERRGDDIGVTHKKKGFDRGKIVGAYAVVYHRGRRPVYVEKKWEELQHLHGKDTWKQNPAEMILTRALTFGLKLQFNISGLYTRADELDETPAAGAIGSGGKGQTPLSDLKERIRAKGEGSAPTVVQAQTSANRTRR